MGMTAQRQDSTFYEIIIFMYSIIISHLNDCTISGMAGVGAESISALYHFGGYGQERADMESAPTVVFSMIP